MRLLHEVHRYYDYPSSRHTRFPRRRRPPPPRVRSFQTPLKLLVLVGIGAGIAQFVPTILCMMLTGASVVLVGFVIWLIWRLFR
jgi:heme A synthase